MASKTGYIRKRSLLLHYNLEERYARLTFCFTGQGINLSYEGGPVLPLDYPNAHYSFNIYLINVYWCPTLCFGSLGIRLRYSETSEVTSPEILEMSPYPQSPSTPFPVSSDGLFSLLRTTYYFLSVKTCSVFTSSAAARGWDEMR